MNPVNASADKQSTALTEADNAPAFVFQPQKLTEIVEMIDLMGAISERVREDKSGDMGGASGSTGKTGAKTQSPRDIALANLPAPEAMQNKLVRHIKSEIRSLSRKAKSLASSSAKGAAYSLSEMYKKIRRLHAIMDEILQSSAEIIRRFYVAVFIDNQPIVGGAQQR